jgi:hypothetical protein
MRWFLTLATNRLVVMMVIALVLGGYLRAACGTGASCKEQINQRFGVDDLLRALDPYY